jgi:hypothetical protein
MPRNVPARIAFLFILPIALLAAIAACPNLAAWSRVSAASPPGVAVFATGYTCEAHPNNSMTGNCQAPRWGAPGDEYKEHGMACPPEWKGQVFQVPGYGTRVCDDTGAFDTLHGLPHIDIRFDTYQEAVRVYGETAILQPPSPIPKAVLRKQPSFFL